MQPDKLFFSQPDGAALIARLRHPDKLVDVIVDTDAFNGIDDQYALAYLVRSAERCRIRAITAAPFYSPPEWRRVSHSSSPADGMEKSYQEVLHILDVLDRPDLKTHVYRGAEGYLPAAFTPVRSQAVQRLLEISREYSNERPLYIVALACATNIASALLLDPTLRDRAVIIWQGGHSHHFGTCDDFNMIQDIPAGRIVFGSGAPLVQFPLNGVVSEFRFTMPELESLFKGRGKLCDYLLQITRSHTKLQFDYPHWSKALVDVTAAAWLVSERFFLERITPAPVPQDDCTFSFPPDRHPIRYVYYIKKDPLTADLVQKLTD